jgi:hypothetical protein
VNPEQNGDPIDAALAARTAMAAPSDFTKRIMNGLTPRPPSSTISGLLLEHGASIGLAVAGIGLFAILDVERLMAALDRAVGTPEGAAVITVAVYVAGLFTTKEPETEAS